MFFFFFFNSIFLLWDSAGQSFCGWPLKNYLRFAGPFPALSIRDILLLVS